MGQEPPPAVACQTPTADTIDNGTQTRTLSEIERVQLALREALAGRLVFRKMSQQFRPMQLPPKPCAVKSAPLQQR